MKSNWLIVELAKCNILRLGVLFCFAYAVLFSPLSHSAAKVPRAVDVGIYLNNIPSVTLKEKKFQVDFNIWFRWKGDDINPIETFKIFNGHIDSKDGLVKKKIGEFNYASQRVEATIYRNFDVYRYPLDNQPLKIQIEDTQATSAELIYSPDKVNANVSPKINVPGWSIDKFDSYASVTKYLSNYGDISLPKNAESDFPRYTFAVDLKRGSYGNFFKLFSMLFLAVGVSLCAFRIQSDYLDARFQLVVAGVFLAAITQSTLSTSLPESDSFGMADQLYQATMAFIVVIFLASIQTFRIYVGGDVSRANALSRRYGILFTVAYVAANMIIVGIA